MDRIFHRQLMRGRLAQRFATLLFWGLLMVLAASVVHGFRNLPS